MYKNYYPKWNITGQTYQVFWGKKEEKYKEHYNFGLLGQGHLSCLLSVRLEIHPVYSVHCIMTEPPHYMCSSQDYPMGGL